MSQKKKKNNIPRQDWDPNVIVKCLYRVWMVIFSALKVAVGAAVTVLLIGIVCGFVFAGTLGDYLQDDILAQASNIDMSSSAQKRNSYMYYVDSKGQIQEYQQIFGETSSEWASYKDIPKAMVDAAIAIEDHRFLEHQGVDWVTTIKACARMFFGDDSVGGSSITQQLIKNMLLPEDKSADDVTVQRKVLEIFRAVELEKKYDKKDIVEQYLNIIYLGQGCQGVRSAAATYFGKEVEMLTPAECASIISITNNPSVFDPYGPTFRYKPAGEDTAREMTGKERNRNRQMLVLTAMKEYGFLTEEEYQEAVNQELVFKNGIDNEDRLATCPKQDYKGTVSSFIKEGDSYFCPVCHTETHVEQSASKSNYSWFADTVLEDVAKAMAAQNNMQWNDDTKKILMQQIRTGGYHIYTTLDMTVQNQVDKIYTDLNQIPDTRSGQQLQSAIVVIDNRSGDIVGIAGGVGEKTGFDDWNRATDAKLQSGSSTKPISVYGPAFELGGFSPATVIKDLPISYSNGAYPLNDNRSYSYSRTIHSGIVHSVNAVSANTLLAIGEGYAFNFAKEKFGISTLVDEYVDANGTVHSDRAVGPLALGAQTWGTHVREMADAFATFANNGVYRKGRTFTKVYDSDGNVVLDNTQETRQILSQKSVDYMNYCLQDGTQGGTGYEANLGNVATAGKTGTTGDNKDRWYCGFTGYYTAAVWSGYDSPETVMVTSYNVKNPSSYLFKKVMGPLHQGKPNIPLYNTSKMERVSVCLDSGKLATSACQADPRGNRIDSALVYPEDRPTEVCDKHVFVEHCSGGGVATEYCRKFAAADPNVVISQKALTKMTENEMLEILKASKYRLSSEFLRDDYVYLINSDGTDGVFKGFYGNCNPGINAPYAVCPIHTKEAWDAYQAQKPTEPEVPAPTENSGGGTEPSKPNNGFWPFFPHG